jgi:hypothetical protein
MEICVPHESVVQLIQTGGTCYLMAILTPLILSPVGQKLIREIDERLKPYAVSRASAQFPKPIIPVIADLNTEVNIENLKIYSSMLQHYINIQTRKPFILEREYLDERGIKYDTIYDEKKGGSFNLTHGGSCTEVSYLVNEGLKALSIQKRLIVSGMDTVNPKTVIGLATVDEFIAQM